MAHPAHDYARVDKHVPVSRRAETANPYSPVMILIAVIVNSMEEARRLEMTESLATDEDRDGVPDDIDRIMITQRLDDLRTMIAELERDLRIDRSSS